MTSSRVVQALLPLLLILPLSALWLATAGDYLGGGQSAEVNAFLNPEVVVVRDGFGAPLIEVPIVRGLTLVPAGVGPLTAELEFRFGDVDPETFSASIGKLSLPVTDLSAEGARVTGVPISPGRNSVVASVRGFKESGGRGIDRDRITLLCCVGQDEQPPVADAGEDDVTTPGSIVTLDGRGSSDPNGDPLLYRWEQVAGPPVALDDASSPTPGFISPAVPAGVIAGLEFELTVSDGLWASFPDRVVVLVAGGIPPPIAVAPPDQFACPGDVVVLDGSASFDPLGLPIVCQWSQLDGTVPVDLIPHDADGCVVEFIAPPEAAGTTINFELTVTSSLSLQSHDTTSVSICPEVLPPVAIAGPDQTVIAGTEVILDGSNSFDPQGLAIECRWDVEGDIVALVFPLSGCVATFIAPEIPGCAADSSVVCDLFFPITLTVTSESGLSASDSLILTVVSL